MNIFGYNRDGTKNKKEMEVLRLIKEKRAAGWKHREIKSLLEEEGYTNRRGNPFSQPSIAYYLTVRKLRASRNGTYRTRVPSGNFRYGFTWDGEKLIPEEKEQAILQLTGALREQGYTYTRIARLFSVLAIHSRNDTPFSAAGIQYICTEHLGEVPSSTHYCSPDGTRWGTGKYGWKWDAESKTLKTVPDEQQIIALILKYRERGMIFRLIAERLNDAGFQPRKGEKFNHNIVYGIWKKIKM